MIPRLTVPHLENGDRREVIQSQINFDGEIFTFCAATIGNPHCVIPLTEVNSAIAKKYGPILEINPLFPNRGKSSEAVTSRHATAETFTQT
ncbi:diaminopimelate epimerase [Anabaenopsis circularis NIES-21]|uniref:Diaminopimelate epimerase n=1 Tax=Anabaenopsis circularis NIES-21 TaxID=1085406 RepID=A0A1Z4GG37_9CYAN|nr:diaminopimelate epimerase [Anabaenopsis circularis NIES-21]